jgi:DeoR/GlpR family transcriptional regulator of sugar metabolism
LLDARGQVRVTEINETLKVREATVRRDLDEMAQRGWIRRTHGGAILAERAEPEPPLHLRETTNSGEKDLIARAAARMVSTGDTVFLGTGTTVAAMVPYLADVDDLTVITNSLTVINQLADRVDIELIVIGGLFRQSEGSMVSSLADQAIRQFRADHVFMGIRGIDSYQGLTNSSIDEATTDRTVMEVAPHRIILADHSKFGQVSTFLVAPLDSIDVVITSGLVDAEIVAAIETHHVNVVLAEASGNEESANV